MSQKALFLTKAQGEFTGKFESRAIPTPGPAELLVKIKAAALNPIEWKIQGELMNQTKGVFAAVNALAAF